MIRALLSLLFALGLATQALAQERITNFDVDIEVELDGDIIVTETIDVISEGNQIQRGIFRELPARFTFMGVSQKYDYEMLEITRGGREEPYTRLRDGNAIIYRIGDANVFLDDGPHTYALQYRVGNQVRHHEDKQEIYWNATGSYWNFGIEKARATIRFPDGARIIESAAYSGGRGSENQDGIRTTSDGSTLRFATIQPLSRKEGLTIAASVALGVLAPMSDTQRSKLFWIRYGGYPASLILASLLGFFYYRKWDKIGRDPIKQPIFTRYAPPEGYSPSDVHVIANKGIKGTDWFTAELTKLAHEGHIEITAEKKLTKIKRLTEGPPESTTGRDILEDVIKHQIGRTLKLGKKEKNARFYKDFTKYQSKLAKRFASYYKSNAGWVVLGVLISLALILTYLFLPVAKNRTTLPFLGVLIALNVVFAFLLPARSKDGEKIMSEIEGFKLYLKTAEADRMTNPLGEHPPAMSVKLYERFLPYAIALGVEKPWTKQFERTMPVEAAAYQPTHMSGSALRSGNPISINKAVAAGLTAGVAAAAPISQSSSSGGFSSGSSGGGFSGGGGGGGGGGGW